MHQAVALAGLYLLRDHYTGGFNPRPDVTERLRVLLRPLAPPGQPVLPALGLDEAITELEALFPEAAGARAVEVAAPQVPC